MKPIRGSETGDAAGTAKDRKTLARVKSVFEVALGLREESDDSVASPAQADELHLPPEARTLPFDSLQHYELLRELGRGGMGRVYLALDTKLDRHVAIKLLPDEFARDSVRLKLFEREARTAAHLNHPNIATIHEFGESGGSYFLAMEHVEGRPLSELIRSTDRTALVGFLDIAIQVAKGLAAAHARNVVHRDLKPSNVMVGEEGLVKILDFGLAKALGPDADAMSVASSWALRPRTITQGLGTPGYAPPEQVDGGPTDLRCDLFSFGVLLYELATGVAPFERDSLSGTLSAVRDESPRSATALNTRLPARLGELITRLMAKRPEDRPQSAAAVLKELEALRADVGGAGARVHLFVTVAIAALLLVVVVRVVLDPGSTKQPVDPVFAEATQLIFEGDLNGAALRLGQLSESYGADDGSVTSLNERFLDRADELLTKLLKSHRLALAGDFETAGVSVQEICAFAAHARTTEACDAATADAAKAGESAIEARELAANADRLLGAGRLSESWEQVGMLETRLLFRHPFEPARRAARELKSRLVSQLESELRPAPERESTVDLRAARALLEEIEPTNALLPELRAQARDAEVSRRLEALRGRAEPGLEQGELRSILKDMESLDETNALTLEVRRIYDGRRLQGKAFDDAIEEYRAASVTGLSAAVRRYEAVRTALGSPTVRAELQQLRSAEAWLIRHQEAISRVEASPKEAAALRESLRSETLPSAFRESAGQHLARLDREVERFVGLRLCREIESLRSTRQLKEAKGKLAELDATETTGIESAVREAREGVKRLEQEEQTKGVLENGYATLRGLLAAQRLPEANLKLAELLAGWEKRLELLEQALAVEERAELRRERARLLLRLGRGKEALSDARLSAGRAPRAVGLLLEAQARLFLARTAGANQRGLREQALADIEHAIRIGGPSGAALYLRGTCGLLLKGPGSKAAALGDLQRAVDEQGLDSADAHYRLAALHHERKELGKATVHASLSLAGALSEEEVVVNLGGVQAALESTMKLFRSDCHLERALLAAAAEGGPDYEAVRADSEAATKLDPTDAMSWYLLGLAWNGLAESEKAHQALVRSLEFASANPAGAGCQDIIRTAPNKISEIEHRLSRRH